MRRDRQGCGRYQTQSKGKWAVRIVKNWWTGDRESDLENGY